MNIKPILLTAALCSLMASQALAQREARTINDNWEFKLPTDKQWTSVNIPHTYNLDAYQGRSYYQGKATYRRILSLPEIKPGYRYFLKIDAASKAASVKVNDKEVGSHAGGYSAFTFDITDCIKTDNTIEITVDNGRQDITPIMADFTFWGGIYRDVWIVSTPDIHFNMLNMGSDGIFLSTPTVNEKQASVKVVSEVTNDCSKPSTIEVRNEIFTPDGKLLQTIKKKVALKAGETKRTVSLSKAIATPQLWTPETPILYKVKTSLVDTHTGKAIDEKMHKVGFRWFAFDGEKGFSLNGKPYKLRGFNRHQDQAPVGVALPDEAHRRDIKVMKDMGSNFIRIAHYPQDDALLEACDELGMLAWEEIPIIDRVPDTPGYADNCERNLREMIRQHYNHPSVINWGYMNEILLVTPGPGNKEWPAFKERTVALVQRLEKVLKEEDPTRKSVMAFNMTNLYNEIGLNLVDVVGWNLYHGWYVDKLSDFDKWCEDQHQRYPNKPMIISEWGAGSDRRLHSYQAHPFDFSIEYQQTYIEHYLPFIEEKPWISGCSYWNFIDFNVAARQESMPRVNNKGAAYNDRTLKDVGYYFKAMWRKDVPVVHIASRDWATRTGKASDTQSIKIYSNLSEVELIVNGKSQGKKKVSNCFALFDVSLPFGSSTLEAKGFGEKPLADDAQAKGGNTEDAMTIQYNPLSDIAKGEELAINVGSNCYFTSSLSDLTWLPDQAYQSGSWGYVGGESKSTTSEIENTIDGPIYQTWREGDLEYKIDAPKGEYEVELLLADVTKPATQLPNLLARSSSEASSKDVRFDVIINGEKKESAFTPTDGRHYRTAFKRRYIIRNDGTSIDVQLKSLQGKAFLNGIKVRKLN